MGEQDWIAGGVRLIKMMVELHRRGFQQLRICPYEYPLAWRLRIAPRRVFSQRNGAYIPYEASVDTALDNATYSGAHGLKYFGWKGVEHFDAERLAGEFERAFPDLCRAGAGRDWEYAGWLSELSGHVSRTKRLPFVLAEYFEPGPEELSYLPLRDHAGDGQVTEFPLPPTAGEDLLFDGPDLLREECDALKKTIASAIRALQ